MTRRKRRGARRGMRRRSTCASISGPTAFAAAPTASSPPSSPCKVGQAAGLAVPARRLPPPGGDRQGHAPLRLHDRDGARRRLHLGRHGRAPARPDADAGGRHADPLDARRSRRHDLGLAQFLRGQRHQAVRAGRLQAQRRGRAGDRGADRLRPRPPPRRLGGRSAAPSASRASTPATSSSPSAPCRARPT